MPRKRFVVLIVLVVLILLVASIVVASLAQLQKQLAEISRRSVDYGRVLVLVVLGGVTLSVGTVAFGFWRKRREDWRVAGQNWATRRNRSSDQRRSRSGQGSASRWEG
jgi:predicted membrane channel-forming protein YqfA (hemolysin III family)